MPAPNIKNNRFYEMRDRPIQGGEIKTYLVTTAAEGAELMCEFAEEYRENDRYSVEGNCQEDGYRIFRDGTLCRRMTVEGPFSAEDLGYEGPRELIEEKGWHWRRGADYHFDETSDQPLQSHV